MRKFLFWLAILLYLMAGALYCIFTSTNNHELVVVSRYFFIGGTGSLLFSMCQDISDAFIMLDWLFDLLSHWD